VSWYRDRATLRWIAARYLPFSLVVPLGDEQARAAVSRWLPWVTSMSAREGRATAYVCRNFTCRAPVTTAEELDHVLDDRA